MVLVDETRAVGRGRLRCGTFRTPLPELVVVPLAGLVLVGVCSLAGTTVAYLRFGNDLATAADMATLVAAGGLIGAMLGALSWRGLVTIHERLKSAS